MPRSADQHGVRIQRSDRVDPGLNPTLGVETTLRALHVFGVSFLVAQTEIPFSSWDTAMLTMMTYRNKTGIYEVTSFTSLVWITRDRVLH